MIPFGHDTVTLVQRVETVTAGRTAVSWAVQTLRDCSWRRTQRDMLGENGVLEMEGITCRIPADQPKPQPGDLLILGDVTVTISDAGDFQRLIEQYRGTGGAFIAASVADNARPGVPLPHWRATGA